MTYVVFSDEDRLEGTAQSILEQIKARESPLSDIRRMDLEEYVRALIENAHLFLPKAQEAAINQLQFDTDYDRALKLLDMMPDSGTRILRSNWT